MIYAASYLIHVVQSDKIGVLIAHFYIIAIDGVKITHDFIPLKYGTINH